VTTWDEFERALAEQLPLMNDGDTVVLRHGGYHVQFAQNPEDVDVEAVSNEFLPPDKQLDAVAERRLMEMGWRHPRPDPDPSGWWDEVPWPMTNATARRIAGRLRRTLEEVFRVGSPEDLSYQAWHYTTNEKLTWPVFAGLTPED
jgi:hypothetical protein